jgi:toxin ParE1/3/4
VSRSDLRAGLRVIVFERRAAIAFSITADAVTIMRILYGGQNLDRVVFGPEA